MLQAAAASTSSTNGVLAVIGVIAGAAVSGVVAIILAFIQRKSLNDQAERQPEAQREQFGAQAQQDLRKWRLDARRGTYADYLVATEAFLGATAPVSEVFGATWPRKDDGVSEAERVRFDAILAQLQKHYGNAFRHGQLVRLAGPSGIASPIDKALLAMTSLHNSAADGFSAVKRNMDPDDLDAWSGGLHELREAIEEFISQASLILEGEASSDRAQRLGQ